MTILVEKSVPFDLRMLRSFRCLRPLKMVSKVPSKLGVFAHFPEQKNFKNRNFGQKTESKSILRFIYLGGGKTKGEFLPFSRTRKLLCIAAVSKTLGRKKSKKFPPHFTYSIYFRKRKQLIVLHLYIYFLSFVKKRVNFFSFLYLISKGLNFSGHFPVPKRVKLKHDFLFYLFPVYSISEFFFDEKKAMLFIYHT